MEHNPITHCFEDVKILVAARKAATVIEERRVSRELKQYIRKRFDPGCELTTTTEGRPYLKGSSYDFSVSHTKKAIIAVVSKNCLIGFDATEIPLPVEFSHGEWLQLFSRAPKSELQKGMFWALREAFFKSVPGLAIDDLVRVDIEKIEAVKGYESRQWTSTVNGQRAVLFESFGCICALTFSESKFESEESCEFQTVMELVDL